MLALNLTHLDNSHETLKGVSKGERDKETKKFSKGYYTITQTINCFLLFSLSCSFILYIFYTIHKTPFIVFIRLS